MIPVALIQREQFIFDASGVWLNDKEVVLFFGNKKGKSTIVSRLHDNGYNIFTDYGCRLSIDNNKVTAYPSYPILDLWEDAFDAQKTFKKKQIIAPNIHRYQINISNSFINKKAVVKHIYALKRSPNTQTFSTPISSSELMMRLGHSFILNTLANNNLDKKKLFNFLTKATLNTKKSILFKQDNNITDLINLITKELKTHE